MARNWAVRGVLLVGLCAVPAAAQTTDRWERLWQTVCEYDGRWCGRLKQPDGAWRKPSPALLWLLASQRDAIRRAAALYRVDPRAIVGCIAAEHTLHMGPFDRLEDHLVSSGIAPSGRLLGRTFTFGWAQVNITAAVEVEPLAAAAEHRGIRSTQGIAERLLMPEGAILYTAALLRVATDAYAEAGFDIANSPALLATIYNLGAPSERAERRRARGEVPRMNHFGLFVEMHLATFEQTLDRENKE